MVSFARLVASVALGVHVASAFACGGLSARRDSGKSGGTGASGGSGATGGGVAAGGVGASGGFGGTGAVGGSGVTSCFDPDGTGIIGGVLNGYDVRSTTEGANGSFVDECDVNGGLIEYACEPGPCVFPDAGAEPGSSGGTPCPPSSGAVIPTTVVCDGPCADGRCFQWCANTGDELSVDNVTDDGVLMLRDDETRVPLRCVVDESEGGADCASSDLSTHGLAVMSPGPCVDGTTTFVAELPFTDEGGFCTYTCTKSGS